MRTIRRIVLWVVLVAALFGVASGAVAMVGLARWGTAGWYYHHGAYYRLRHAQRLLRSGDLEHAKDIRLVLEADGYKDHAALLRGEDLFLQAEPYAQTDRLDVAGPRLDAALTEFNKIRDKGALRTEASVIMGKCYLYMKQLHQAELAFLFVLDLDAKSIDAQRGLASIYFDQGAMARAILHLEKWEQLDPLDGRPFRLAAFILKEQGRYDEAIKNYEDALARNLPAGVPNQNPARIRKELVECLVKHTEYQRALQLIDDFSPLPEDASALEVLRAECLLGLGQLQEARTALEDALELYKDNNHLYRLRAKLHTDAREYAQALACLERALFIDRQDVESRYQLLLTLRQLGRKDDADKEQHVLDGMKKDDLERQSLEHAALDHPWDPRPRLRLAELWQKAGRPDLAEIYRQAASQCPPAPAVAEKPNGATQQAAAQKAEGDERAIRNPGYLGPQACAPCHAQRLADFKATRHFRACCVPEPETMPAGFTPGRGSYTARAPALSFEMAREGGNFYETAIRAGTPSGQRSTARIGLVYGSAGTADEIYFTWHGDRLNELPIAWLHPLKRWGEQPFNPYMQGDLSRSTTPRCLECHNTWVAHTPGTNNGYARDSLMLGVTCERCHGPAAEHVAFHRTHPEADSGQFIVKPAQLSRDRQMDMCGQCHSNAAKRRGPAFSYRPGEPLDNYFRTNLNKRQEDDHVANQVHYLRQSKCFQKSASLTCTTCHDPHLPPSTPTAAGGSRNGSRACLKCHQPEHCKEQSRVPVALRGDCVGCHMPRFTRIQVFFHTEDDQYVPAIRPHNHQIAVYPAASHEILLAWHRTQPDAKNQLQAAGLKDAVVKHWLGEAGRFHKEYRFMAEIGALREAYRLDTTPATREKLRKVTDLQARLDRDMFTAQNQMDQQDFSGAMQTLRNILELKPDWAKAQGKLGTCCANAGQYQEAEEHLRAVAKNDPDDAYGYAMLGWIAYLQDRPADAVEYYRHADDIEPYTAKTNYQMGLALAKSGKVPEAIERFRQALTIDPNYLEACQMLSRALTEKGDAAEAARFAQRAARLSAAQPGR